MKKVGMVLFGVLPLILLPALPALAQSDIPPDVGGKVVAPPGSGEAAGIAFTGSNVRVWMIMAAALLILGTALFLAGRHRARSART